MILRGGLAIAAAGSAPWWTRAILPGGEDVGPPALARAASARHVVNQMRNPRAAHGLDGWTGVVPGGQGSGPMRTAGDVLGTTATAVDLRYSAVDAGHGAALFPNGGTPLPVAPGQLVWGRAAAKVLAGAPSTALELRLTFLRGDGSPLPDQRLRLEEHAPAGQWVELAGFMLVPEDARSCRLGVWAVRNLQRDSLLRVTNAMLVVEPGEYLPYVDGDAPGAGWQGPVHASPSEAPFPELTRPTRAGFLRGFNDNGVPQSGLRPVDDVALNEEIGATVLRVTIDLRGPQFQSRRGAAVDWRAPYAAQFDELHRRAARAKIRLLPVLLGAPTWMGGEREEIVPPAPQHYGEWARIAAQLAERWPDLAGIEPWNEPNLGSIFWNPGADAAAYTALLAETAAQVRRAQPGLPVLTGGINGALADAAGGADRSFAVFLEAMYAAGAKGAFDGLSLHAYPIFGDSDRHVGQNLRDARRIMAAHGDSKPLWITETGTSTIGTGFGVTVSERHQAAMNRMLYGLLKREPDVQAVCFHQLVPFTRSAEGDYETGFAAVARDGRRKPVFDALRAEWRNEPAPPVPRRARPKKRRRRRRRRR